MSYSEALEQQVRLLRWCESPDGRRLFEFLDGKMARGEDFVGVSVRDLAKISLANGDSYYCSGPITQVVRQSGATLPLDYALHRSLAPGRDGFIWLSAPLQGPGPGGSQTRAVSWSTAMDCILLMVWTDMAGLGRVGTVPTSVYPWRWGEALKVVTQEAEDLSPSKSPPFASPLETFQFIGALFLFIQQRIFSPSVQRAERHAISRLERDGWTHEPLIRVVELRRKANQGKASEDDPKAIAWTHQWVVSGHWRQQPYPSKDTTQPIWIMPYVKGPGDKPLKPPRAKVFAVVR